MKRYCIVTLHVSQKNPISREKLKIISTKIQISIQNVFLSDLDKKNFSYTFSKWISWQINLNLFFQRNVGSDLERAQTSEHCCITNHEQSNHIITFYTLPHEHINTLPHFTEFALYFTLPMHFSICYLDQKACERVQFYTLSSWQEYQTNKV